MQYCLPSPTPPFLLTLLNVVTIYVFSYSQTPFLSTLFPYIITFFSLIIPTDFHSPYLSSLLTFPKNLILSNASMGRVMRYRSPGTHDR